MERDVTRPNPRVPRIVTITPATDGWRVGGAMAGIGARNVRTIEEAAAEAPAGAGVRLLLPVSAVLMERMRLPSKDNDELGGMVVLQLEKTLPYGAEEITSGFNIIRQEENESDLLAAAVSNGQLDELCEPLRKRGTLPGQVGIFAIELAAKFSAEPLLGLIYREAEATILAVIEHGKLVGAYAGPPEKEDFLVELPRLLLTAEIEGAPVNFTKVVIERDLGGWVDRVRDQFPDVPVEMATVDLPLDEGSMNLVPSGWTLEKKKLEQQATVKQWLARAGVAYLCLLLIAAGYIICLQHEVGAIAGKVEAAAPAMDAITQQKARWKTLAAATDPTRYTVELLQQINKSIPSDDLHVTEFVQTPTQFTVQGEASSASMAIKYLDLLKSNPDLQAYRFEAAEPVILPNNDHAQFQITGSL